MNFNPFITLLNQLQDEATCVIIWHEATYTSNFSDGTVLNQLKPLVFKMVNGNGSHGKLNHDHVLLKDLNFKSAQYYSFHQIGASTLFILASKPFDTNQISILFQHELKQLVQNEQSKSFIQRKLEHQQSSSVHVQDLNEYVNHLLVHSIIHTIPLLQKENIQFSPELLTNWKQNKTPLPNIIDHVEEFIHLAQMMELSLYNYTLVPSDFPAHTTQVNAANSIQIKTEKASLLLDRYEKAAQRLNQANFEINGKNIALSLEPPVSPAAVTDALKKNRKKIISLLMENPSSWPLIRNHLKPLKDIHQLFATN